MRKRKSSKNAVDRLGGEGTKAEILNQQFKPGDLTWVEIHNSSWWPAQVKHTKKYYMLRFYVPSISFFRVTVTNYYVDFHAVKLPQF